MRTAKRLASCLRLAALAAVATVTAAADIAVEPLAATARRAGLRVLESDHLVLVTDRPARAGDGVEDLPRFFDEAVVAWCGHYGIDPVSVRDWRAVGCLVVDRERFRAAGLLPATIPEFTNGFCDRNRFWMMDQSNPAYRRHLFLHEGVHAFTLTTRGLDSPEWYTEGIAEFLATHRLERGDDGREHVVLAPLPLRQGDVEQLGRIETLRAAGRAPALVDVMAAARKGHRDISAYAADWAAVAVLALHPVLARSFAAAERGPLDADFNARLAAQPGWNAALAAREYAAFVAEVDYGWDFARMAVDWSPGRPLVVPTRVTVDAARGWQNTGMALEPGGRCRIAARGRIRLGAARDPAAVAVPIESEADGISLHWYRGRPVGRLLAAQWVDRADGTAGFVVVGTGATAKVTAAAAGPLYLRVNDAPGDLADNAGGYSVDLLPP